MQGGIFKLVINTSNGFHKKFGQTTCVEEFAEIKQSENNSFFIESLFDSIRDIFLIIELPKLTGNLIWRNNLLYDLINFINIKTNFVEFQLNNNYIKMLLEKYLVNYSDKLLFRNLSNIKREKYSKKGHVLILPLNLKKVLKNPNEIIMTNNSVKIDVHFNSENLLQYPIENINLNLMVIGVFYDVDFRHEIVSNYDSINNNQKILLGI